MYVQSFNIIEAKLAGVRDKKLLVFCTQNDTMTHRQSHEQTDR